MFNLGSTELIIILIIVLVLFGGGKLASVGTALGKGIRNFRKSFGGEDEPSEPKRVESSKNDDEASSSP